LKILQLIQKKQYRGAEIFACQLSNQFLEAGHEVKMVSIYNGNAELPFVGEIISLEREVSWRYTDFAGWRILAHIIKEYQPDIIQANAADTLKYTIFSKLIHGWKVPIIFRNASSSSYYIKNSISRSINHFLLKRTDLILSVSQSSKKDINNLFPFTENYSKVLPVGIDDEKLKSLSKKEVFYGKHIFHVGSFTKEKNHIEIINLFEEVKNHNKSAELHLIGDGPLLPVIQELVKRKKLQKSVYFYGGVKSPYLKLGKADVLILPSLVEGLPAVILEAMYLKVPVIAYDVGGINEILHKQTGNLIAANDRKEFTKTLINTLEKPDKNQIDRAFTLVKDNYNNQIIAHQFLQCYKELNNNP
jgi:L-malate glycosyltransferase